VIHADLGAVAMMLEQQAVADRHMLLGEHWLERAGSLRAVTVVRFNRGVLANDRSRWREGRRLTEASRALRGGGEDASFWLEEIELGRSDLARGDLDAVERVLPRIQDGIVALGAMSCCGRRWRGCVRTSSWPGAICARPRRRPPRPTSRSARSSRPWRPGARAPSRTPACRRAGA